MSLENPDLRLKAEEFEALVGNKFLSAYFPFGLLTNTPIFNAESREEDLFATEIDHLIHYRRDGIDHLVIIECKNQEITNSEKRNSPAPSGREKWFVHYSNYKGKGRLVTTSRNVRDQIRRQTDALLQLLDNPPSVVVESWVVHRRRDCEPLMFKQSGGRVFRAFNTQQLNAHLKQIYDSIEVIPINRSLLLGHLQKGIPKQGAPHPAILDSLSYIQSARKTIDRKLFKRFNGWFHSKHDLWAVKGTAGSGKSILLAYTLAVLATNYRVVYKPQEGESGTEYSKDFMPRGIPKFTKRKIYAFAMSNFQLEALQRHYQMFLEMLAGLSDLRPSGHEVHFAKWDPALLKAANVAVIDEAHDLSLQDQQIISSWHKEPGDRYLIIGVDRQQHTKIQSKSKQPFIKGLIFSSRHNMLSRTYRSPITAFMTSKALLFRWYSDSGPMMRPGLIKPNQKKFEKFYTFKGGIGVKVEQDESSDHCKIWIRNDTHPANYWNSTVDLYDSSRELQQLLTMERLGKDEVMWLRFDGDASDIEDRNLANQFEFHRISGDNPESFINDNIKGLEFPVVVIEGLPEHFNNLSDTDKLWQARRLLYICSTRAVGFLYFVNDNNPANQAARNEFRRVLDQFQNSVRMRYEPGETWCMNFDWRPDDIVELTDYDDR